MPTRNVSLLPDLDEYIETAVASGRYPNAGEVVRDGLRLLHEHDRLQQAKADRLHAALKVGLDDIARGDVVGIRNEAELDAFFDEIWQELEVEFSSDEIRHQR